MDKAHKAWTGIPAPGRDIISCLVAQEGRRRKDTVVAQAVSVEVKKRVLVPVDGSRASLGAMRMACSIAKRNKGRVYAIYVIEVPRALPLDAELEAEAAKGEAVLDQAERAAEEMDYEAEGEILQAREASHAIVDEAIERGVDAIVLGIEYKKPLGEFQLDHTAQYILKHAPCEVWLYRGPAVMK